MIIIFVQRWKDSKDRIKIEKDLQKLEQKAEASKVQSNQNTATSSRYYFLERLLTNLVCLKENKQDGKKHGRKNS